MTEINNNPFCNGTKLKLGLDLFAKGFSRGELTDAYYSLVSTKRNAELLCESASFAEIDDFYNDGEPTESMVMEAVRVRKFAQTEKTMAALQRVLNRAMADKGIVAGDAVIGEPKKSGLFASVTVQFPLSDGQTISIIFHSPDNNRMKITADDEILAFRWLLNKRDITVAVSPEGNADVSLEEVGKRTAQLVEKNSDRFQGRQRELVEAKKALDDLKAQVETATTTNEGLMNTLADTQNQAGKIDSEIVATQTQLEKTKAYNDGLQAKIDALQAANAGNKGKAKGEDTTGGDGKKEEQDAAAFEEKKVAFEQELVGRGFKGSDAKMTYSDELSAALSKDSVGHYSVFVMTPGERQIFAAKTVSGVDAKIKKALTFIDKKLAGMKKDAPALDPTTPAGYAAIMADEALQLKYQDDLDPLFGERILGVRNGLRDLGWDAPQGVFLMQKDVEGYGKHSVIHKTKNVGAGKNVVGVSWEVDAGTTIISDDLTKTPEQLVTEIDAAAKMESGSADDNKKQEVATALVSLGWSALTSETDTAIAMKAYRSITGEKTVHAYLSNGDEYNRTLSGTLFQGTTNILGASSVLIPKGSTGEDIVRLTNEFSGNVDRAFSENFIQPESSTDHPAVAILSDILAGKYETSQEISDKLDEAATELEKAGLMEVNDALLQSAADYLTTILKKEAA